jgi:murein L,D-transpeptidase YafK
VASLEIGEFFMVRSMRGDAGAGHLIAVANVPAENPAMSEDVDKEGTQRAAAAAMRVRPALQAALDALGMAWGAAAFVRLFKREAVLEMWLLTKEGRYALFKRYPICARSGVLGPKTRQGDRQAPEGFYRVERGQLHPRSQFHLAVNLGYPNAYDRAHGYTGDFLMIHGHCVSTGCYAMGDAAIEEIYTLLDVALHAGQEAVEVHAFPFPLDTAELDAQRTAAAFDFWSELKPGYDAFERTHVPPRIEVAGRAYRIHELTWEPR